MALNGVKGISLIKKILDRVVDVTVVLLMIFIVVVVFLQVFSRYVLNCPLTWSEELARYLFIWIVFTAAAVVFRENKHMSVDFLIMNFPDTLRKKIDFVSKLLIAAFLLIMIIASPSIISLTMRQTSPTLSIPMGVIYLAFPVSMFLMLLELVFRVLGNILHLEFVKSEKNL